MTNCTLAQELWWYCNWWQWTLQWTWLVLNVALALLYVLVLCALYVNRKKTPFDSSFFRLWSYNGGFLM
jgi:hypothetical protein